jgi:AraC-like DNA-binding protein
VDRYVLRQPNRARAVALTSGEDAAVRFEHYVPPRPLADFVELIWYGHGHALPRSTERVLPMGTMELVIALGSSRTAGGGVVGPHSEAFFIEHTAHDELVGVHFKPAGAFPFLGCGAGELRNRWVALEDLWSDRRAERLVSQLHEAPSVATKVAVVERWLLRTVSRPLARHPAVAHALRAFRHDSTVPSAAATAAAVGLSQRRFIEVFREQVGLTPKLFCRIERFQRLLALVGDSAEVDWSSAALSCGYFDQAHFVHDFREFTGLRPTEYLSLRIAGQSSHVRVLD